MVRQALYSISLWPASAVLLSCVPHLLNQTNRYRANRTLCGSLEYRQVERVWRVVEHAEFPLPVRAAVFTVLCASKRPGCVLSLLPVELLLALLEVGRLAWDEFPPLPAPKRKNAAQKIANCTTKRQKRRKTEAGSARLELDNDTDAEQELEAKKSRRRKKSRRESTVASMSSPAVSPAQDPPSSSEAHVETRRVRRRRRSVRVVES